MKFEKYDFNSTAYTRLPFDHFYLFEDICVIESMNPIGKAYHMVRTQFLPKVNQQTILRLFSPHSIF